MFSFPVPILPLVVLWASYYTCSMIRDVNPWFQKCGCKENLFSDNDVIMTYWLKKRIRRFTVLEDSFLFKRTATVNLTKFKKPPSLYNIHLGNFTLSDSVILMEYLIRCDRGFEIFLIDHFTGDIGNKNIANI